MYQAETDVRFMYDFMHGKVLKMKNIHVGIVGATGYVGAELVRILSQHPYMQLTALTSKTYAGKLFSEVYPSLSGICDLPLAEKTPSELAADCDIVITALPHGVSAALIPDLLEQGLRVLDHSGDFRFRDCDVYEKAYKLTHPAPDLLQEAVYGLPELYRGKLKTTRLAANPGCYPTCSILALAPLLSGGLIQTNGIIIDAVSGYSGAGRKGDVDYSFCETTENYKAYSIENHRHTPEIEQELSLLAGSCVPITFTPHLAPMKRGMLATIYCDLKSEFEKIEKEQLLDIYKEYYKSSKFVRILPLGESPQTKYTAGSNFLDIGIFIDSRTGKLKILSGQDNLGKGAAAQAVQTLNIMADFPEETGIWGIQQGL